MFSSLQKRWKVSKTDLLLILCVFAITGTTTAFLSRSLPEWIGFTDETHWAPKLLLRLAMLIIGYQVILLCVAFLFGQFPFFWRFEKKLLQSLKLLKKETGPSQDKTNNKPDGKN
ncbi:diacylglyceryl transferase [Flavisolibacter sp. BT320]|nr:diacylglyceryl transferase [Flavisolibacter longurius]